MVRHALQHKQLAALAILAFLLTGFLTVNEYGYGDDEQWLMKRGELAARIAGSVLLGKVPPPVPDENWVYHPSLYATLNYQWVRPVLVRAGFDDIASGHFLTLLMAAVCLAALFALARRIVGAEAALYSVLLLICFPRFIAHAHYNPKDIPTMAFVVLSFVFVVDWLKSGRLSPAATAGIMMGLASSCHLNALTLLPVFPVLVVIRAGRSWARPAFLYLVCAFATLYLLWPLLWIRPGLLLDSIRNFSGAFTTTELGYLGKVYSRSAVPWHYIPFYMLVATPLVTLGLIGLGVARFKDVSTPDKALLHALLLSWALVPVVIRLNPWVVKYNDIRHVFISLPPLMIYAGWGLKVLVDEARKKLPASLHGKAAAVACLAGVAYFLVQVLPIHPYEGDYFNEAFRVCYRKDIERYFDFPSWMTSYRAGLEWLDENAEPGSIVQVPNRLSVVGAYHKRQDLMFVRHLPADYVMVAGRGWEFDPHYADATPVFEVRRYGSRLLAIFREEDEL